MMNKLHKNQIYGRPTTHPPQLFNNLDKMEIRVESEDEEMSEYDELEPENNTQEEEAMIGDQTGHQQSQVG